MRPRSRRNRIISNVSSYDRILTFSVVSLLIIGTILVWAATRSWFASQGLDPQYYVKRHVINIVIGAAIAYGVTLIDYRLIRAYTPILWVLGVLGLIAVAIPGVGSTVNGSRAWISLPGGFQIQPAELAKISIILGISLLLSEGRDADSNPNDLDVVKALALAGIPMLIILLQPDFGTFIIIGAAIIVMIAVSGAPTRWVAGLLLSLIHI